MTTLANLLAVLTTSILVPVTIRIRRVHNNCILVALVASIIVNFF